MYEIKMKKTTIMAHSICLILLIPMIFSTAFVQSVNLDVPNSQTTSDLDELQMYLWIKGSVSGEIEGEVTKAGLEGYIEVLGYHHQVTTSSTSHRQHSPLRIIKLVDKSSPILMQALCTNENLDEVALLFYRFNNATSEMGEYYRITLNNARLIEIESHAQEGGKHTELLAFEYETITWLWVDGGIQTTDSYEVIIA